jgi:predicted phage tail protein
MVTIDRSMTVFALVFLILLAGCSGGLMSGGGDGGGKPAASSAGDSSDRAAKNKAETTSTELNAQAQRALIRTGHVRLEITDYDNSRKNLTRAVREQRGYVSDSSEQSHQVSNTTWTSGRIVFRVPVENFSVFFQRVKKEGEVQQSNTNTTDVTDRVVDLEARLKNLRAQRDRLRKLYNQANDTKSVLAVGEKLSDVQGEIERLEAQRRALAKKISYAMVTVELHEPAPKEDVVENKQFYETGIISAFLESVNGVVVTVRALFVAGAYLTPYLIVFGLPLLGLAVVLRRRVR